MSAINKDLNGVTNVHNNSVFDGKLHVDPLVATILSVQLFSS